MSKLSEKTTIYLNPTVKKFLQFKAVNDGSTVSQIVNDEFAELLEDIQDLKIVQQRKNEKTIPFEDILSEFGISLDDLQDKV